MPSLPVQLTVVMPAYNEEALLAGTLASLLSALDGLPLTAEIVIVDDGSRDRTPGIADELAAAHASVRALHQPNQGLGGALRTGFAAATGEYVISWPADAPVTAADLQPFADNLGRADVLVGCRSHRAGYNPLMRFNSRLYPLLVRVLFGLRLRDVNWIHLYRTALVRRITFTQRGIPMLTEALVRLRDLGATFLEVPSEMPARTAGVASASRPRIMWRTLTGLFSFWLHWRGGKHDAVTTAGSEASRSA